MGLVMSIAPVIREPRRSLVAGVKRGMALRCPNCGRGALYRKYLKVQACPACGNDNALYPADDAPPYFTILVVGHLVVGPLLFFNWLWKGPTWLVLATVMPALLILTLVFLPVVKGAVVGLHWALEPRDLVEEA